MAGCTINLGLLPDLSGIIPFDNLKIDICTLVEAGGAFTNPLADGINTGITSIDSSITTLDSELGDMTLDIDQLDIWEGSPPGTWTTQQITDVNTAIKAKETCATDRRTASTSLKVKINTNFRGHTDILSGVDLNPTGGTANVFARSGLEDSLNVTRKQFNKNQVSETANMFGSIFNGEKQLSDIKLETDKLPVGSVSALAIQSRITGSSDPSTDGPLIINDINNLTCLPDGTLNTFASDVQGLIDGDEATYVSLANELLACMGALSIDGWVTNPFKLQLLNCIGSAALKTLASI